MNHLQDAVVFGKYRAESVKLSMIGIATRYGLELFVHIYKTGGQADRTGIQTLAQQRLHLSSFCGRGGTFRGSLAHDPQAQHAVTDEGCHVDGQVLLDAADKLVKGFPVPGHALLKGDQGHFFNLIEHAYQLHAICGFQWRQR